MEQIQIQLVSLAAANQMHNSQQQCISIPISMLTSFRSRRRGTVWGQMESYGNFEWNTHWNLHGNSCLMMVNALYRSNQCVILITVIASIDSVCNILIVSYRILSYWSGIHCCHSATHWTAQPDSPPNQSKVNVSAHGHGHFVQQSSRPLQSFNAVPYHILPYPILSYPILQFYPVWTSSTAKIARYHWRYQRYH